MAYAKRLVFAAVVLLLSACGGPVNSPQQNAFLQDLANRDVTCTKGADCEKKWERAIAWVRANPDIFLMLGQEHFTITKLTKNTIQTGISHVLARGQGLYPGYRIIRFPREDGTFGMEFHTLCEQVGCKPSGLQLKASFVTHVMGLPPGVTEASPGVYQKHVTQ